MDFFQGSSPPNFISFCLANQPGDVPQTQANSSADISNQHTQATASVGVSNNAREPQFSPPPFPPIKPPKSPSTTDSNDDVNSYADEKFRFLEQAQQQFEGHTEENPAGGEQETEKGITEDPSPTEVGAQTAPLFFRTSTPTPGVTSETAELNLAQLETRLIFASSSRTALPELFPTSVIPAEASAVSFLQHETDEGSSFCDVPKLPTGTPKVRCLDDGTGTEEAGDTSSQASGLPLYAYLPVGNEAENAGERSSTDTFVPMPSSMRPSTSAVQDSKVREISGRSRAILKQYFDEDASTINFPIGHRTVAFTEPQIYHLLRVLTDETLKISYTVMEQMVIEAVRGAPVTSNSRTDRFKIRPRAQIPDPGVQRYSEKSSRAEYYSGPGTDTSEESSAGRESRGFESFNETDSSGEMALISQAFKEPFSCVPSSQEVARADPTQAGFETAEQSSLDATLSELRTQTSPAQPPVSSSDKLPKKKRRGHTRGVPMKEEFFSKIGSTRSFISGPADPLHNPYMVWCHICKKIISVKTKGTLEILRHHMTEKQTRREQRWRYEHLKSVDPVTGKVQHRVRGRNGKILTKIELAKELPKFMHVELVDIGERFPFYDDFVKGTSTTLVTPMSRAKTQIHLIGDFVQHLGDLGVLRKLWAQIGSLTNYQASYCDFDWGEERISVGSFSSKRLLRESIGPQHNSQFSYFPFRPSSNIFSILP